MIKDVMVNGNWVVREGIHTDEKQSMQDFSVLLAEVQLTAH